MRTVVFAYHDMGLSALKALKRAGYEIAGIFSHEDDPNENCWFGSVKAWAAEQNIPVYCPPNPNQPEWIAKIVSLRPEMIFSFYYRHMLREEILGIPSRGAYNLHGSLLPAYRGRCPVNWVLVNGETETGVTLHHMVKKADAGDIVGQKRVSIDPRDTARSLYGKLCAAAAELLDGLLPLMKEGKAPRIPQDISLGSYFGGRGPEDGRIDWGGSARRIFDLIRAVTEPYPGAFARLPNGARLMVWWALPEEGEQESGSGSPGKVEIDAGQVMVRTGGGRLHLLDIQAGNKRMTGEAVSQYFKDKEGLVLS
jgi:UDP-4-amino-4-deoxy-L-arabinose formyltransferase/UDP-glucuronic acid dehydrogenase (UDP-4-keto-hexauronic acid decarboxylating)